MKAKISMQETLAEATKAISEAGKLWRKKPETALNELAYCRAMCIRARDALMGEIDIEEAKPDGKR